MCYLKIQAFMSYVAYMEQARDNVGLELTLSLFLAELGIWNLLMLHTVWLQRCNVHPFRLKLPLHDWYYQAYTTLEEHLQRNGDMYSMVKIELITAQYSSDKGNL